MSCVGALEVVNLHCRWGNGSLLESKLLSNLKQANVAKTLWLLSIGSEEEIRCYSNGFDGCFPDSIICDGYPTCDDFSDEINCTVSGSCEYYFTFINWSCFVLDNIFFCISIVLMYFFFICQYLSHMHTARTCFNTSLKLLTPILSLSIMALFCMPYYKLTVLCSVLYIKGSPGPQALLLSFSWSSYHCIVLFLIFLCYFFSFAEIDLNLNWKNNAWQLSRYGSYLRLKHP